MSTPYQFIERMTMTDAIDIANPFFNPNLSLKSVDCRPAFPPRGGPVWRTNTSDTSIPS